MSALHSGHRERVRQEFLSNGADNFSDVRALELLLFYAIDRKDVNPLSHALLERFGSLKSVLSASVDELKTVTGIEEKTAILIRLVGDLNKRAALEKPKRKFVVNSSADAFEYLRPFYLYSDSEKFIVISLNSDASVIKSQELSEGVVNSVNVDLRKIAEIALTNKAVSVIVSHNHPGGNANPSDDDVRLTRKIKEMLSSLNVNFLDHVIVCDSEYYSFADNGYLNT